jgi:hypothetical protein
MNYRILGRTGLRVGEIGMGLEHLLDKDEKTVIETVKAAVDGGVSYLDCHPGHDYDERPEPGVYNGYIKLGKALAQVDRSKLTLTYISSCRERDPAVAEVVFDGFLRATGIGSTDVFILGFCDKAVEYEQVMGEYGIFTFAKRMQAEGKTRFIGIATHSTDIAMKAIHGGDYDVLMFPVNPAFDVVNDGRGYDVENLPSLWDAAHDFDAVGDTDSRPRKDMYVECERHGVGLVAMKPFAGGYIFREDVNTGFTPVHCRIAGYRSWCRAVRTRTRSRRS